VAQNVVLTKVDAYADNSKIGSAANKVGAVTLDASSGSTIIPRSSRPRLAIGGGGSAGIGVSNRHRRRAEFHRLGAGSIHVHAGRG